METAAEAAYLMAPWKQEVEREAQDKLWRAGAQWPPSFKQAASLRVTKPSLCQWDRVWRRLHGHKRGTFPDFLNILHLVNMPVKTNEVSAATGPTYSPMLWGPQVKRPSPRWKWNSLLLLENIHRGERRPKCMWNPHSWAVRKESEGLDEAKDSLHMNCYEDVSSPTRWGSMENAGEVDEWG